MDTPRFLLPCFLGDAGTAHPGRAPGDAARSQAGRKEGAAFGAGRAEGKGKEDVNLGKRSGML